MIQNQNCREENGVHTCDKRRTKTYIESTFPTFQIEHGFSEEDLLWEAEVRESRTHVEERAKEVLDMIFNNDGELCRTFYPDILSFPLTLCSVVSITAHGGIINAFLAVLGRTSYALPTGGNGLAFVSPKRSDDVLGVLPVVVRSVYKP